VLVWRKGLDDVVIVVHRNFLGGVRISEMGLLSLIYGEVVVEWSV
jgi:hypothetical protein